MHRRSRSFAFVILALSAALAPARPVQEKPLPAKAPAENIDGPPVVSAKAWAVADGKTGKVLWGSKEHEPLAIASTTKIMTAYIVLRLAAEDAKVLDEVVTFSEAADKTPGSSSDLKAGEKVPVRDLLYGLLLPSGNDAATAFAEHFGKRFKGDGKADDAVARFVAEMNRTAQALKMGDTKYLDPHGLSKNVASARDLLALTFAALKNPTFAKYVRTRRHTCEVIDADGKKREVTWGNTNKLLDIEGYEGVKTGTTTAAGSCLVSSGRYESDHLLVVVLGCTSNDSRYADARNLYRWAWRERGHGSKVK
ncbi:D-alanyl-D-alanine carboxypeptidase [Gemmata sp. G18]|uniref:D-alanyl-D-alanine carboxypeptidase n=1 Tax=Gemmata palustris TaxID=2822762 RepID=A0ABS5BRQ5_9BACT|nr:serine hydrolase [Gemmata palustris]MBP3956401.1 D-alanyl-D-alanine carboxypeptidase [Gemmata palustris]